MVDRSSMASCGRGAKSRNRRLAYVRALLSGAEQAHSAHLQGYRQAHAPSLHWQKPVGQGHSGFEIFALFCPMAGSPFVRSLNHPSILADAPGRGILQFRFSSGAPEHGRIRPSGCRVQGPHTRSFSPESLPGAADGLQTPPQSYRPPVGKTTLVRDSAD